MLRPRIFRVLLVVLLALSCTAAADSDQSRIELCRSEFNAAHSAFERGRYDRALAGFEGLCGRYAEMEDYLLYYAALCAQRLDSPGQVLDFAQRLIELDGYSRLVEQAQELQLYALIDLGSYSRAEQLATQQLEAQEHPGDSRLRFIRARALEGRGQYAAAAHEYLLLTAMFKGNRWHDEAQQRLRLLQSRELASQPKLSSQELLEVARSHFGRDHPRTAGYYGQQLIERGARGAAAAEATVYYANRLSKSRNRRDRDKALELFNKVLAEYKQHEQWVAAALYLSTPLLSDSEADQRKAALLERYPQSHWAAWAAYDLADAAWDAHDFVSAAELFLYCAENFEQFERRGDALWRGGFASYMTGQYSNAVRALEASADVESDSEDVQRALFWAARACEARGDRPGAALGYFAVLDQGPHEYYGLLARERLRSMGVPPLVRSERFDLGGAAPSLGALAPAGMALPTTDDAAGLVHTAQAQEEGFAAFHLLRLREQLAMGLIDQAQLEVQALRSARDYGGVSASALLSEALWDEQQLLSSLIVANYAQRLAGLSGLPDPHGVLWSLRLPKPYFETVKLMAEDNGVDPYLMMGLMRQESAFQSGVTSRSGARGLMQVMPSTGKYIARKLGVLERYKHALLYQPDVSIALGCWYIGHLQGIADNDAVRTVASYNGGPGNAAKWWPRFSGMEQAAAVELIPLRETRNYVKYVMRNWSLYRERYLSYDPNPPIRLLLTTVD
ncbi:MAG: lytic transglycosylase domain-containing protein [Candidatus Alcyoniella australis]|nr:lytic transglycosylase domain-containing protein [Candidatus Alcyoniella australis]